MLDARGESFQQSSEDWLLFTIFHEIVLTRRRSPVQVRRVHQAAFGHGRFKVFFFEAVDLDYWFSFMLISG